MTGGTALEPATNLDRMQLLLVEDDRDLRRFLSKAFREEGYNVAESESGDRGLERALEGRFTCIVLDVMLPGLKTARSLRLSPL